MHKKQAKKNLFFVQFFYQKLLTYTPICDIMITVRERLKAQKKRGKIL